MAIELMLRLSHQGLSNLNYFPEYSE